MHKLGERDEDFRPTRVSPLSPTPSSKQCRSSCESQLAQTDLVARRGTQTSLCKPRCPSMIFMPAYQEVSIWFGSSIDESALDLMQFGTSTKNFAGAGAGYAYHTDPF